MGNAKDTGIFDFWGEDYGRGAGFKQKMKGRKSGDFRLMNGRGRSEIVKIQFSRLAIFIEQVGGIGCCQIIPQGSFGFQFAIGFLLGFLCLTLSSGTLSFALFKRLANGHEIILQSDKYENHQPLGSAS